jgi:hypothetical protein
MARKASSESAATIGFEVTAMLNVEDDFGHELDDTFLGVRYFQQPRMPDALVG